MSGRERVLQEIRSYLHKQQILRFQGISVSQRLSPERRLFVYRSIRQMARPKLDYFVMTALAAGIASLGLLLNNPAVIIGAMLVAPLMGPIIAIGMGVIMGDLRLLKLAGMTTLEGVILAIFLGAAGGGLSLQSSLTAEILSRTQPTLLDLAVALLSGLAGAYALCREDVSASLPGVAISAALMPPLATVGITLAKHDGLAASGAMLLFFTNLVAISAASIGMFLFFGFRPAWKPARIEILRRGMLGSIILLSLVTVILGILTSDFVHKVNLEYSIRSAVNAETAGLPGAEVVSIVINQLEDSGVKLEVTLRSSRSISYQQTVNLQQGVATRLGIPVALLLTVIPTTQLDPFYPPTPTPTQTPTPTASVLPEEQITASPTATATPTFTPSPTPTITLTPTPTLTPLPTATPTMTPKLGLVVNTGGRGVFVRQTPGGVVITAWPEGSTVIITAGPETTNDMEWLYARGVNGLTGWVAAKYLSIAP